MQSKIYFVELKKIIKSKYLLFSLSAVAFIIGGLLFFHVLKSEDTSYGNYQAQVDYAQYFNSTVYERDKALERYKDLVKLSDEKALNDKLMSYEHLLEKSINYDTWYYSAVPGNHFSSFRVEPEPWLKEYTNQIDKDAYCSMLTPEVMEQYTRNLFVLTAVLTAFLLLLLIPASVKEPDNIEALQSASKVGSRLMLYKFASYFTVTVISFAVMVIGLFISCSRFNFMLFKNSNIHSAFSMTIGEFVPIYNPEMTFGQYVTFTVLLSFLLTVGLIGITCILASYAKKNINGIAIGFSGFVLSCALYFAALFPFSVIPKFNPETIFTNEQSYLSVMSWLYNEKKISGPVFSGVWGIQLLFAAVIIAELIAVLSVKNRSLKKYYRCVNN